MRIYDAQRQTFNIFKDQTVDGYISNKESNKHGEKPHSDITEYSRSERSVNMNSKKLFEQQLKTNPNSFHMKTATREPALQEYDKRYKNNLTKDISNLPYDTKFDSFTRYWELSARYLTDPWNKRERLLDEHKSGPSYSSFSSFKKAATPKRNQFKENICKAAVDSFSDSLTASIDEIKRNRPMTPTFIHHSGNNHKGDFETTSFRSTTSSRSSRTSRKMKAIFNTLEKASNNNNCTSRDKEIPKMICVDSNFLNRSNSSLSLFSQHTGSRPHSAASHRPPSASTYRPQSASSYRPRSASSLAPSTNSSVARSKTKPCHVQDIYDPNYQLKCLDIFETKLK